MGKSLDEQYLDLVRRLPTDDPIAIAQAQLSVDYIKLLLRDLNAALSVLSIYADDSNWRTCEGAGDEPLLFKYSSESAGYRIAQDVIQRIETGEINRDWEFYEEIRKREGSPPNRKRK